jgi:hypothetical protein
MEFETIIYSLIAVIILTVIVYFIMQNRYPLGGCSEGKCASKCSGDVCSL